MKTKIKSFLEKITIIISIIMAIIVTTLPISIILALLGFSKFIITTLILIEILSSIMAIAIFIHVKIN